MLNLAYQHSSKMKRHIIYIILACFILSSCSEKYDKGLDLYPTLIPRYLAVTPTALSFSSASSSNTLQVTSTETPWRIENGIDWISTSPASAPSSASVNVSVTENKSGDAARVGIFYLKSGVNDWQYESPISVTQANATPYISLSKTETDFTGAANTETITVSANCTWTVSSSEDWLTVSQKDNSITLSATSNESNMNRTAIVYVVHHSSTQSTSEFLKVRQAPASINASTETLTFDNTASSVNVTVNAEASWSASSSASWIDISPSSGNSGTTTMKISVSPNTSTSERTGYVNVSVGGSQRIQIPVRQRGIYLEAEQSELSFAAAGGSQNISVLSNTNWTISSAPSWISVSPSQGEGDGTISVTASDNPNTSNRSGVIHLTQPGVSMDVSIMVNQAGKTFDVNTTVLNFEDKQSTQTVSIQTDGTWSASTSAKWIAVSPASASGNSTLSVTVSENTGDNERSGQVVVVMGEKSATINIVQKGKYFTVSNNLLTYTSKGGAIDVSISTNDSWSAKVENGSTWLTLSKTSGAGNVDLKVTASDNASVNSRTGYVVVETPHGQSVRIMVSQDARYLTVDNNSILFYAKGGTSEPITVSTDGSYTISRSDAWFSISRSSNTFTVTATENKTSEPRTGTITVALSNLVEGSYSLKLTVTQLNNGGSFMRNDFGSDQDYDNMGTSNGNLTISGFGADKNYDTSASSGTTLSVSKYQSDKNWDSNANSGVTVSVTGYNADKSLDSKVGTSGTITKNGFGSDQKW